MSSNDKSDTISKTNSRSLVITRDDEHTSECQKVENRHAKLSETKEYLYTPKKIATKQAKQGPEDKHTRHMYSLAGNNKEQDSTSNKTQQSNLHVRYWTYLFDNLHRSIDEIFCACESEENVSGCHVCETYFSYTVGLSDSMNFNITIISDLVFCAPLFWIMTS